MEMKEYIQSYEKLTHKKAATLQEKLNLEMDWIKLHKSIAGFSKTLTKRRKADLEDFKKKSLKNAKEISEQIYQFLWKGKNSFENAIETYERIYFKCGVKGVIERQLEKEKISSTFKELMEDFFQKQTLNAMTEEKWKEGIRSVISLKYSNFTGALEVEKEYFTLFHWWYANLQQKGKKKMKTLEGSFEQLDSSFVYLETYILRELGYLFQFDELAKTKPVKRIFHLNGVLQGIKVLEDQEDFSSPVVKELLNYILLKHPKDEYPETRKMKRKFVLHVGPTNSGKTYHAINRLMTAKSGLYLAPIRLLALEIQEKLNDSNIPCNLLTGEIDVRMPHAKHCSSTIELANFKKEYEVAVIDEFQMVEDETRGSSWLHAIFGLKAKEVHLCGAPHALSFAIQLIEECNDEYEIREYERQTPLIVEDTYFSFPYSVQKGDALIAFSKGDVLAVSKELQKAGFTTSVIYGKLPPETRRMQVEMFANGETDVVVSTDAIGIGLNLPIKRVVFLNTEKFDGGEKRKLTSQEIKQIAGRAGRRGKYDQGFVTSVDDRDFIENELVKSDKKVIKSVIAPSRDLTKLPIGTLRQRLTAWQEAPLDVPYLEKANISSQLFLLSQIEHLEHEMEIDQILKTLYVPFDAKERQLLLLWTDYVRQLKEGKKSLTKPKFLGGSLAQLTIYFQQLNIYYNFSKKFNLGMNKHWLSEEKTKISGQINHLIRSRRQYAISI